MIFASATKIRNNCRESASAQQVTFCSALRCDMICDEICTIFIAAKLQKNKKEKFKIGVGHIALHENEIDKYKILKETFENLSNYT